MQAFSADNAGSPLWTKQMPGRTRSPRRHGSQGHRLHGGAGSGGTVYAVDEETGKVKWTAGVATATTARRPFGDHGVYVSYPCNHYKFDPQTGAGRWHYSGGCSGGAGIHPSTTTTTSMCATGRARTWCSIPRPATRPGSLASVGPPVFWESRRAASSSSPCSTAAEFNRSCDRQHRVGLRRRQNLTGAPIAINDVVAILSSAGNLYIVDAATARNCGRSMSAMATAAAVAGTDTGLGAGATASLSCRRTPPCRPRHQTPQRGHHDARAFHSGRCRREHDGAAVHADPLGSARARSSDAARKWRDHGASHRRGSYLADALAGRAITGGNYSQRDPQTLCFTQVRPARARGMPSLA